MLRLVLTLLLALTTSITAHAAKPSIADSIDIPSVTFTLKNGLTVVVHEDHKAPVVAVNVWYHVGSKDEAPGKSGFAHLFEHLMFNGSEHFNFDYFKALGAMGATDLNGTTNRDRTNYFQTVPTGGLDRVLFLESDRMGHLLGVIDQPRLDEQRGVVQNEKRQGENQPYGQVFNEANKALFPSHHPYAYPRGTVIGSMEDLDAATLKDVQDWFKAWYGPQNATVVIAGDITVAAAKEKAERFFGHIPPGPPLTRPGPWAEPLVTPVRKVLEDRVPQARLYRMWITPDLNHQDAERLQLAAALLGQGKTSRLYARLVDKDKLCTDVSAGVFDGEIASQFIVMATAKAGVDIAAVERAVAEELAAFVESGPTAVELARRQTATLASVAKGLERVGGFGGKSDILARSAVFSGSADAWRASLKRLEAASAKDVGDAARRWLAQPSLDMVVVPFAKTESAGAGVDRSSLPAVGAAVDAAFPALQRATLKNGIKVVLLERKGVPLVDVRVIVPRGTSADTAQKAGLARFAMNALDEATTKRTAIGLAEALEGLGASLSTSAGLETSSVSLQTLRATLDGSLDLLGEVVLSPAFSAADLERVRQQQLAGLAQEKNTPAGIAARVSARLVFGADHPYGLPASGTEAAVAALTRDDVTGFFGGALKAGSVTVVVAGDLALTDVTKGLERVLGRMPSGEVAPLKVATPALPKAPVIYLVDRPGSLQSVISAIEIAPALDIETELAVDGMNKIIGGDFNSRLNMNLREDKHWSYGVRSNVVDTRGPRLFSVNAPVQTDKTAESVAEVHKELTGFVAKATPTAEEFDRIQSDRVLKLPGLWETTAAVAGSVVWGIIYGAPDDFFQGYGARLKAVTRDQVVSAAKTFVKPQQLSYVVVGDRAKVEDGLRALRLGEVKVIAVDEQ